MLGLGGQAEAVAPSAYPAGALAEPLRKAELPLPQAAARAELGGVGAGAASSFPPPRSSPRRPPPPVPSALLPPPRHRQAAKTVATVPGAEGDPRRPLKVLRASEKFGMAEKLGALGMPTGPWATDEVAKAEINRWAKDRSVAGGGFSVTWQRTKLPLCACNTIPGRRPVRDAAPQRAAQKRSRANLSITSRRQLQTVVCAGPVSKAGLRRVQAGDGARRSLATLAGGAAARRAANRAHPRRNTAVLVGLRITAQPGRRVAPLPAAHPCQGCTRGDSSAQRRAAHGAPCRSSVNTLSPSAHGALRITERPLRRF